MKESRMTEVIEDSITKTGAMPSSSNGTEALETKSQKRKRVRDQKNKNVVKPSANWAEDGCFSEEDAAKKKEQQRRRRRMQRPCKASLVHPKRTHPIPRIVSRFFRFVHTNQKNQQNVSSASRSTQYPATMSHGPWLATGSRGQRGWFFSLAI